MDRRGFSSVARGARLFDQRAVELLLQRRGTAGGRVVSVCCELGRGGLVWLAIALLTGSGRRRVGRARATATSGLAIGSALAASALVARATYRRRPCHLGVEAVVSCPDSGSFPSDQAAAAFAAVGTIGWFQPALRPFLLAGASTVGVARIAAGVHHPSDVLGGVALGVAIGHGLSAWAAAHS